MSVSFRYVSLGCRSLREVGSCCSWRLVLLFCFWGSGSREEAEEARNLFDSLFRGGGWSSYCLLLVLTWLSADVRGVMWRASLFGRPVGAGGANYEEVGGLGGRRGGEGTGGGFREVSPFVEFLSCVKGVAMTKTATLSLVRCLFLLMGCTLRQRLSYLRVVCWLSSGLGTESLAKLKRCW